jgi:hypothetical protein
VDAVRSKRGAGVKQREDESGRDKLPLWEGSEMLFSSYDDLLLRSQLNYTMENALPRSMECITGQSVWTLDSGQEGACDDPSGLWIQVKREPVMIRLDSGFRSRGSL